VTRILYDDVAKKGRHSRQSMWDTYQRAHAAYRAANLGAPAIERRRWPLLDAQELGQPTTSPSYMPRNSRGRAGVAILNAINESNAGWARMAARLAQNQGPPPAISAPPPAPPPAIPAPPPVHPPAVVVPLGMK